MRYFTIVFLLLSLSGHTQDSDQYISVDQNIYTVEQLVKDVLINNQCATITNIVSLTGTDFGSTNGIGYFSSNGASFPLSEGIILSTGNAAESVGPETGYISSGNENWPGDADLANAIPNHDLVNSYNATYITFDFVPLSNAISFNFVFASDEYGFYQCEYTDAFAFLLTDNETGVTTNLALVPGTLNPISVLSVRDNEHNTDCESVNEEYFEVYYGSTGLPPIESPTNYTGHTVKMTVQSTVVYNRSYSIKLVIADAYDPLLDAAVFLEGGSFNLGQDLEDITLCENDSVQFNAPTIEGGNYQWSGPAGFSSNIQNPVIENISSISQGEYFIDISLNDECAFTSSLNLFVNATPEPVVMTSLELCDDNLDGFMSFILTDKDIEALNGQTGIEVTYHATQSDADNNSSSLTSPFTNDVAGLQTIFIRLTNDSTGCFSTMPMDLVVHPLPILEEIELASQCDDDTDGLQTFDMSGVEALLIGNQTGMAVSYHATQSDAENNSNELGNSITTTQPYEQTIYIRLENLSTGCYTIGTTELQVDPLPVIPALTPLVLCDDNNVGDLQEEFDLSLKDTQVVNGQNAMVSYHATLQDAYDNSSPLPTLFTSGTQTIFAALQDTISGCRVVSTLDLIVDPIPDDFDILEINICDYTNVGDLLVYYPNINIFDSPDSTQPLASTVPLIPGNYYVTQLNDFNCNSLNSIKVNLNCSPNIPDGFSPNGDGFNDYFNIQNLYDVFIEHKLKIFNRFGTLIFEGDNSNKWEGTVHNSNKIVPVGTYFYLLELNNTNNNRFTGWVYINY
ncbi:gliding motility-associated C-terminal domain-containing protein [Flavobacteriaceae bacterium]|nr:gliding motility-associated C-terminal domain-containing protein [Flavobacteriaceae bacterium]